MSTKKSPKLNDLQQQHTALLPKCKLLCIEIVRQIEHLLSMDIPLHSTPRFRYKVRHPFRGKVRQYSAGKVTIYSAAKYATLLEEAMFVAA